jgi:hypothetical protein
MAPSAHFAREFFSATFPTRLGLQLAAQMATTGDGTKMGPLVPSVLVRLEGAALATLAVYLYVEFGGAGSSSLP